MRIVCLLGVACGDPSSSSSSSSSSEPVEPSRDAYPEVVEPSGYAIHGVDLHPPLLHRVVAVPCAESIGDCRSDADCGAGAACLCGPWPGADNVCVEAECLTDDDCEPGPCFLSVVGTERCPTGLHCSREGSICEDGGDCPGNGTACTYVAPNDRFECSLPACR
jgi:hypothetical protein